MGGLFLFVRAMKNELRLFEFSHLRDAPAD